MKTPFDDNFSFLNEFNNWIKQDKVPSMPKIQEKVYPKNTKNLGTRITIDEGNHKEIKKDFIKSGGTVIGSEEEFLRLEVNSGTFYINKKYIY